MKMKRYLPPLAMWLIFETIAVTMWLTLDNIFYLFNHCILIKITEKDSRETFNYVISPYYPYNI